MDRFGDRVCAPETCVERCGAREIQMTIRTIQMNIDDIVFDDGESQVTSLVEKVLICVVSCSIVFFGGRALLRPRVGMCSVETPPTPSPVAASRELEAIDSRKTR